jgi:hypothetical protein
MIFGWDYVSCDDFGNCHDKIIIAGVDFIGDGQFVTFICKGMGASGSPL